MSRSDELEDAVRMIGNYVSALENETVRLEEKLKREQSTEEIFHIGNDLGVVRLDQFAGLRGIDLNMRKVRASAPDVVARILIDSINAAEDEVRGRMSKRFQEEVNRF